MEIQAPLQKAPPPSPAADNGFITAHELPCEPLSLIAMRSANSQSSALGYSLALFSYVTGMVNKGKQIPTHKEQAPEGTGRKVSIPMAFLVIDVVSITFQHFTLSALASVLTGGHGFELCLRVTDILRRLRSREGLR
jgi:hypothetical protein